MTHNGGDSILATVPEALAVESGRLASELHGAISELDPARWRANQADSARTRLRSVQRGIARLRKRPWPAAGTGLRKNLSQLHSTLSTQLPDEEMTAASSKARWMAFRRSLVPRYEELQATLRELEVHVPSLRPTNYTRSLFHVFNASLTIAVLWALPEAWMGIAIAVPLALAGWTMERARRGRPRVNALLMKLFGPVAHPHERRRVNSATWYVTALGLLSLTQAPLACGVGLAALGIGDPVAALIGRRFGRTRLLHGRTLEGTLAFAGSATIAGAVVAWAFAQSIGFVPAAIIGGAAAVAGAGAELLSLRVDDNLSIPLAGAAAAALAATLLGVPL